MIKKINLIVIYGFIMLYIGCSEFPTSYDRIDANVIRTIDFIYEPAEAAPGDSVVVKAIFAGAGKNLVQEDIYWTVSFNVFTNFYGVDTAMDIQPLIATPVPCTFSDNTSCIGIKFQIPEGIMYTHSMIPDDWASLIPNKNQSEIPDIVSFLGKNDILSVLDSLSVAAPLWASALESNPNVEDSLLQNDTLYFVYKTEIEKYIPAILQLFTVNIRLFAKIEGAPRIRSTYAVRYNSRFKDLPGSRVYYNTNPVIDSVGIYKVTGEDLMTFDPAENKYKAQFFRLFGPGDNINTVQTIIIDKGYTYFIAGFTSAIDTALSIDAAFSGADATVEKHYTQWYFQHDENEIGGVSAYDFMNIMSMGNFIEPIYPPVDKRVQSFTIWLEVYDYLLNELFRPVGSTVREVSGKFSYTDAYLNAVKDKKNRE